MTKIIDEMKQFCSGIPSVSEGDPKQAVQITEGIVKGLDQANGLLRGVMQDLGKLKQVRPELDQEISKSEFEQARNYFVRLMQGLNEWKRQMRDGG